jgi:DNA-binding NarL/FixJ family response regulator
MVLAVVEDLLFGTKIRESAKRAGVAIEFATTAEKVSTLAAAGPSLVIIDLNFHKINPLSLITSLRGQAPMVAFFSHVQVELRLEAERAGCERVLPRSAFVHNLPHLLAGHSQRIFLEG